MALSDLINIIIHLDKYLIDIFEKFGTLTYLLLFFIILCETGLVVMPFLPGDSLLFVVGAFAAQDFLDIKLLFILLLLAAILGDTMNYWIGSIIGPKVFKEKNTIFKKEYLIRTEKFYEKHGGKTIILARFIPIIRTFAPFVAGIGKMPYKKFLSYNIMGGLLWVSIFLFGGYYFGNISIVKENFTLTIMIIILLSLTPGIFEMLRNYKKKVK